MLDFISKFNIWLGVASVIYPLIAAWHFRNTTKLGHAVSWMFIGESIAMAGTLVFAILAYTGYLETLSGAWQSFIRTGMFVVALITSIHLGFIINFISKERGKTDGEI